MDINLEKSRREELRWMLLLALNAAQPVGTAETILLKSIVPVIPDITSMEIRRALDYLAERDLVSVTREDTPVWFAKINNHGIDVVEYTVECHPGIARPKRW